MCSFVWFSKASFNALGEILERERFSFTPNSRREFLPHDQVFSLFFFYSLFFYTKITSVMPVYRNRSGLFLSANIIDDELLLNFGAKFER